MNKKEATRRLQEAETHGARAWRRLMYLRDSELLDYDVEDLYRIALREYQMAHQEILKARYVAAVTRPGLLGEVGVGASVPVLAVHHAGPRVGLAA